LASCPVRHLGLYWTGWRLAAMIGVDHASGPRYFGFDIDYVPVEELMRAGK